MRFLSTFSQKTSPLISLSHQLFSHITNFYSIQRFSFLFASFSFDSSPPTTSPLCRLMAAVPKSSIGGITSHEGVSNRLWKKFRRGRIFSMFTPFVVSLASGILEVDIFRQYISQDVHFLEAFAQAYDLAEDRIDDDYTKTAISNLKKSVWDELKMHDSFAKEWGCDITMEVPSNSVTVRYRDFLLATASGKIEGLKCHHIPTVFEKKKIAAYTLGAMAPCMSLYAFIAKELMALLDHNIFEGGAHPYKKWIDNYASKDFQASALKIEELVDRLSVSLTGEDMHIIENVYHQALMLEIQFFSAHKLPQQTVVPLSLTEDHVVVCSDFDLTCTMEDSSVILGKAAIVNAKKSDQCDDLRNRWTDLSVRYRKEYEQCIEIIAADENSDKFSYTDLCLALEKLSDFEKRANSRVVDSGILRCLSLEDIKRVGEEMIFRDGCVSFFQALGKVEKFKATVHVISCCWCSRLIKSAFSSGGLDEINILANELIFGDSVSTGEMVKGLETPIEKMEALRSITKDGKTLTVYIGDSLGDLLCLLSADIGIVMGSDSTLMRVGLRFGVSFTPLFEGVVEKQKKCGRARGSWRCKDLSGTLYTVSCWDEIHAFVLGF